MLQIGLFGKSQIRLALLVSVMLFAGTCIAASDSNSAGGNIDEILLKKRRFIPKPGGLGDASKMSGHVIIQFEGTPGANTLDGLNARWIKILQRVPRNAVMAYVPPNTPLETIAGIRWVGKLKPTDKISRHLNKSLGKGFALVDVYPDVDEQRGQAVILGTAGQIIDNPYLASNTYLVRANREIVTELSTADEVSWIWAASDAIISGEPVYRCRGAVTALGPAAEYVVHDDGWDGPGRGSASLKYHFVSGTADMTGEQSEVKDALDEWARYAALTFTETLTANQNRSFDILWGVGDHGGCPYPFEPDELAHAFYPSPPNAEPIAGDIHFNDAKTWCNGCSCGVDVFSVALHEAGHSLGLDHSDNPSAVMYEYYQCVTGLHQDDIDGIQSIYASACTCSITVTSPSSASSWLRGTTHTIVWTSQCNSANYVRIQLYKGASLVQTVISSTPDDGSYSWTIPSSLSAGSDYRIRIVSTSDSSCYDYSSYFSITCSCLVSVSYPSSSSVWACGGCYNIWWNSECNPGSSVRIQLYKGSSLVQTITSSTADDGSYQWCVPGDITADCDYRVRITSTADASCYDYSDYFSSIPDPEHYLIGHSRFSILLTGTLTTLAEDALLELSAPEDIIIRGNINVMGADSDLLIRSDLWVFHLHRARFASELEHDGSDLRTTCRPDGMPFGKKPSVYVHRSLAIFVGFLCLDEFLSRPWLGET